MKNKIVIFSVLCLFAIFSGCDEKADTFPEAVVIDPQSLSFGNEAESADFRIASNTKWTVSGDAGWLTVNPASGEGNLNVTASVSANSESESRTGVVTVKTESGIEKTLQVLQNASISINPAAATVNSAGGEITVTVAASGTWKVLIPNGIDWVSVKSQSETQAVLAIVKNPLIEARLADIAFGLTGFNLRTTFKLTQDAFVPFISIDPATAIADFEGEEITVAVTANAAWTVQIPNEAASWVSVKSQTETQVVFAIKENTPKEDRRAVITFKMTGYEPQATFDLSQKSESDAVIPGKVLDACESLDGWSSWLGDLLKLDTEDMKEGNACLRVDCFDNGGNTYGAWIFEKTFEPFDSEVTRENGYIACDLFVSEASRLLVTSTGMEFHIKSGGSAIEWGVGELGLKNGWNKVELSLSRAPADFDLHAITYFGFMNHAILGPVVVKIDHIRFYEK